MENSNKKTTEEFVTVSAKISKGQADDLQTAFDQAKLEGEVEFKTDYFGKVLTGNAPESKTKEVKVVEQETVHALSLTHKIIIGVLVLLVIGLLILVIYNHRKLSKAKKDLQAIASDLETANLNLEAVKKS